ncbi:1000_t:CDS:2 [Acaulospora morrowiae]|uniref:1000_t:CDS:1 n=1 Tax=Acaulospora morrowiae TaxID=94023 RepID=A0A9N8VT95_9GLOM|nr:1000_t:CDS:2 [Acaulospora morrowiae]
MILGIINAVKCYHVTSSLESYSRKSFDGCKNLHEEFVRTNTATWENAKACFETFPYDFEIANETINTLKGLFGGFYSFLNQAKEEPKPGFTFKPIDLLDEFDKLLKKKYEKEFDFWHDVASIIFSLRDAHVGIINLCYDAFIFDQRLSLYSAVIDGKQIIKVFNDIEDPTNVDCQVTEIDGDPALDVIVEFARDKIRTSRDLGVRFNNALASLTLEGGVIKLDSLSRQFSLRSRLPPTPTISYALECPGNVKKNFTRQWFVSDPRSVRKNFTDSASYRKALCTRPSDNKKGSTISSVSYEDKIFELELSEGNLTVDAHIARFYTLQDFGVVVISTEDISSYNISLINDTLIKLNDGFQDFARKGIKKVVLDLTNNKGGELIVSEYILVLLFPDITPSFPADQRLTDLNELAISTASDNSSTAVNSKFSMRLRLLAENKKVFTSVQKFFGSNCFTRGGVHGRYSTKYFYDIESIARRNKARVQQGTDPVPLNWTRDNLIILTNGACGSACATITQILVEKKEIKTVAVGGLLSQPQLSYSSFPGGVIFTSDQLLHELNQIGLNRSTNSLIPDNFPQLILTSMSIDEFYSSTLDNVVLEFFPRPSDYRLYYDEQSMRDPSKLWIQAANLIGKDS